MSQNIENQRFTSVNRKGSWDCPRRKISMSNETDRHVRFSYYLRDRRMTFSIFKKKSSSFSQDWDSSIALPRRIIHTIYTRRDLPPPATALFLK